MPEELQNFCSACGWDDSVSDLKKCSDCDRLFCPCCLLAVPGWSDNICVHCHADIISACDNALEGNWSRENVALTLRNLKLSLISSEQLRLIEGQAQAERIRQLELQLSKQLARSEDFQKGDNE